MCCVECFQHEWVRDYIREASSEKGDCEYCGAEDVAVVGVCSLYRPFENLLHLYTVRDDGPGDFLIDLLQDEHEVFNKELYENGDADQLLDDIMWSGWDHDTGEPPVRARDLYRRLLTELMAEEWQEFCARVKDHPQPEPDLPELLDEELIRIEVVLPKGSPLFRARLGFVERERERRLFEGAAIGAPPADNVTNPGRAHAIGEVVLYVSDQEVTAVAEVRPSRGLLVSVAEVRAARDLRIVDLSRLPPASNPFTDEAPDYEEELCALLVAFGEELGRPLRRADDSNDYLPCQKLVRRIRKSGIYDGIPYPSAMSEGGTNVVLFDPALADIGPSKLVEVKQIAVTYGPPWEHDE